MLVRMSPFTWRHPHFSVVYKWFCCIYFALITGRPNPCPYMWWLLNQFKVTHVCERPRSHLSFFWLNWFFRPNATHLPYAIVVCVCVYVCVCLSLCVCMARLWTSGKRFEIETSFCFKLRGITPDIICKTQIGLQIPRWRTKWRPWNTIIGCNSAIY